MVDNDRGEIIIQVAYVDLSINPFPFLVDDLVYIITDIETVTIIRFPTISTRDRENYRVRYSIEYLY